MLIILTRDRIHHLSLCFLALEGAHINVSRNEGL